MSAFCPQCGVPVAAQGDRYCRSCGALLPVAYAPVARGWYPQTEDSQLLRYWDGTSWTAHTLTRTMDPELIRKPMGESLRAMDVAPICFALSCSLSFALLRILERHGSPGGDATLLTVSELAIWLPLLMGVFAVSRGRGTGDIRKDFAARISLRDLGPGALGGLVALAASSLISVPLVAVFHNSFKNPQIGPTNEHLQAVVLPFYIVIACIGAPLVEELFFRGLILTRLIDKWGPVKGIAATSVMFGSAHLIGWDGWESVVHAIAVMGAGGVLGYLRYKTGRLGPGIFAHALNNLIAVIA